MGCTILGCSGRNHWSTTLAYIHTTAFHDRTRNYNKMVPDAPVGYAQYPQWRVGYSWRNHRRCNSHVDLLPKQENILSDFGGYSHPGGGAGTGDWKMGEFLQPGSVWKTHQFTLEVIH